MSRRLRTLLLASALCAACSAPEATGPAASPPDFAARYAAAFQAEAQDSTKLDGYLDLVDLAIAAPDAPGAIAAALAAVDALTSVSLPDFESVGPSAAAYRTREGLLQARARLERAYLASERAAPSPALSFIRGTVATALHDMALFLGDAPSAHRWAKQRGCAQEASVLGPLDATPLRALDDPSPVDPRAAIASSYPGIAPFAASVVPVVVRADACQLDTQSTSPLLGERAVVVDLAVPRAGTVSLALTTSSAAVLDAGGARVLRRPFDAGSRAVTRLGTVGVSAAGTLRVVVRVASRGDGGTFELDAWGPDGQPLAATAPRPGATASLAGEAPAPVELRGAAGAGPSEALVAAGLLALGEARTAEHALEPTELVGVGARSPMLDLLYVRALESADDLPDTKVVERSRAAAERVHAAWPASWEATVGRALALERRRSSGEGVADALHSLPAGSPEAPRDPMIATYIALTSKASQLRDVAERAFDELGKRAPGSPLLAAIDARLHQRSGPAAIAAVCSGGLRRSNTDCFDTRVAQGDFAGAYAELARLRSLRDAPEGLRTTELEARIAAGDRDGALAIYDSLQPGDRRMLDALGFAADGRSRLARDRLTARDSPYSLGPLVRALGVEKDPAVGLEEEGKRIVQADREHAFLPGAGTAVLRHVERYGIDAGGLVHFVFYDLRRVSGTSDVAQGGSVLGPLIEARTSSRLLRKRIHKRDGRVLEPDAAANAQQQSDLSQLEAGDYIEQIAEGWALPGDTGQLLLDTPDLLPERTSVREAVVELRRARSIPFALWSHPLLGKGEEVADGDYLVTTWRLRDKAPRRIEDGVPRLERGVGISLGTQTWAQVGRAFEEAIRAFDDKDPFVTRWVKEVAGSDTAPSKALVERIVAAIGAKVKEASASDLSDVAAVYGGGAQKMNARSILELGQGSRSWLVYRALRELGVPVSLAIAETEPWSQVASFPAHVGRFRHPLVIAKVGSEKLWIDADVEGPPLPPGRISSELRGRSAMLDTGAVVPIEGSAAETGDEVDVRLTVDEKGDARGSFTVLLHGRTAQALAEAFETVVGTDRRELLRKVVLGWLPWADVDDVAVSSVEGSWEVALRATIAVHGFGRPEGKDGKVWVVGGLEPVHIVFPNPSVSTLAASYASRGARENALSIESPIEYHVHRHIELPAGASIVRPASAVEVADANVTAHRRVTTKAHEIDEDFALNLPTGTVPAAGYGAFVEKVQAIDSGFMAPSRIRLR